MIEVKYLDNVTLDNVKAYKNAIIYFMINKSIWSYDNVLDSKFNKVLCSSSTSPEFYIKKLGIVNYYDKGGNIIDKNYYN